MPPPCRPIWLNYSQVGSGWVMRAQLIAEARTSRYYFRSKVIRRTAGHIAATQPFSHSGYYFRSPVLVSKVIWRRAASLSHNHLYWWLLFPVSRFSAVSPKDGVGQEPITGRTLPVRVATDRSNIRDHVIFDYRFFAFWYLSVILLYYITGRSKDDKLLQ